MFFGALVLEPEQGFEKLGQVRLAACPDNINTILKITGLNKAIPTHKNIPEAIKSLEV